MNKEYSDYLKFIEDALELAKNTIPRYFSKFSNKIYCNYQKFAIYVLMQKLKASTRGICSILRASSDMRLQLFLFKVPSHSTIVRFVKKIKKSISKVLGIRQALTVAVDATGFELESKSYYYRNVEEGYGRKKTKRFMKLSLAADINKKLILNYKIRKSLAHDTRDFKFLVKKLKCKYVLADKGYDSQEIVNFIEEQLNATPVIPPKSNRKLQRQYDKIIYKERNVIERLFGRLKQFRKLATRFEKIKRNFESLLSVACAWIWLN